MNIIRPKTKYKPIFDDHYNLQILNKPRVEDPQFVPPKKV